MALLFIDGFDLGDYAQKWDVVSSGATTATTRFSTGLALSTGTLTKNFTASSQITVGFALCPTASSSNPDVLLKADSGSVSHIVLQRNTSTGFLQVRRGGTSGTVIATGTTVMSVDVWHYLEIQATIADAGGTVQVRIDGSTTPDINFTGDTRNGGTSTSIDALTLDPLSCRFDDLYILNSTGSSNTTFLGDVRIHTLSPNGNGNSSQLTGSDGNQTDNYLLVDEKPYSSSDYAGSATSGHKDTYTMSNLPAGVASVLGVQNNMVAAKSDASLASARTVLRTGGTDYAGTTQVLATSYVTYKEIYNTNPNTSVAWTISDVDGLEAGMEVV